ncbi:inhibitor of Bruton tyrosine kinase-like [Oppia nitens]|uniref:inhibitor of Bruton tyrosine kinase-like n=1 Tax=Oppia nitens TaxID=1686743 RepID=UPI0023DA1A75|nr:inhibitor of Bruton tyrosine kinase-like [Oppia nitens]
MTTTTTAITVSREPECTVWCRSGQHADQLLAAITGRPEPGDRLQTYCRSVCHNFPVIADKFGRTALHAAASCGCLRFCEWLVDKCGADLDGKDYESGWTALHRALYYGQIGCAKLLVDYGASLTLTDRDHYSPLELLMLDRAPWIEYTRREPCDCYVWGANDNFNLGVDSSKQSRSLPDMVTAFKRDGVYIRDAVLRKFHSLFLTNDGKVYSCGHGHGGRLGLESEDLSITPRLVTIAPNDRTARCESLASGQDHFVLLVKHGSDASGHVYTCGNNMYHQLGQVPAPEKLLSPQIISMRTLKLGAHYKMGAIIGVGAGRYHSLFYTTGGELFTFGLNVGQIGHPRGERLQTVPHKVSAFDFKDSGTRFDHVVTSDGAIVCATNRGDVYVLHEYQCRKVASKQLDIQQLCVVGGHLDERPDVASILDVSKVELQIMILTKMRKLYLWKGSDPVLVRCLLNYGRELSATHISLSSSAVGIVTKDGEVFFGSVANRKSTTKNSDTKNKSVLSSSPSMMALSSTTTTTTPPPQSMTKSSSAGSGGGGKGNALQVKSFVTFVDRNECHTIKVRKQRYLHRCVAIFTDNKNQNFAALQASPKIGVLETASKPDSRLTTDMKLLFDTSDVSDNIHDLVVKVGNRQYYCHKFILATRCEYFRRKLAAAAAADADTNVITIESNVISSVDAFDQIIRFIYYNSNDLFENGRQIACLPPPAAADIMASSGGDNNHNNNNNKNKKNTNKTNNNNNNKNKKDVINSGQEFLNSVKESAKRLGVNWLYQWLKQSGVKIVDQNKVKVIDKCRPPKLTFDRNKYDELTDIVIQSSDGIEYKCHKCILMSRLEYFRGMLSSGWIETSANRPLSLPLSSRIMDIIIDYVYRDESSSKLDRIDDPDFIFQVLVTADQYLIPGLKSYCEYVLVNLLTLKNTCELLELSYIYSADQLKRCSLDFICVNLATLMDNKSLDVLSDEAMADLTECYQTMITRPRNRRFNRYSTAPNAEQFEEIYSLFDHQNDDDVEEFRVNVDERRALLAKQRAHELKRNKAKTSSSSSQRHRLESSSSDINDNTEELNTSTKSLSVVSSPKENEENEFIKKSMTRTEEQQTKQTVNHGTKHQNIFSTKSKTTVSLAEFRTNSLSANTTNKSGDNNNEVSVKPKPTIKWGSLSTATKPMPLSFDDIIKEEQTKLTKLSPIDRTHALPNSSTIGNNNNNKSPTVVRQKPIPIPTTTPKSGGSSHRNSWSKLTTATAAAADMAFSSESTHHHSPKSFAEMAVSPPKPGGSSNSGFNPWIRMSTGTSPVAAAATTAAVSSTTTATKQQLFMNNFPEIQTISMVDIVREEERQLENLRALQLKPLDVISIEDKALDELFDYYGGADNPDECIRVERVSTLVAAPVWSR